MASEGCGGLRRGRGVRNGASRPAPGRGARTLQTGHQNRLAQSKSPYLRQHADNPVDWYPWGDEALRARRPRGQADLAVGRLRACHWCHVMAHESFEDPATAALMNAHFINIKVDREERPDIDEIYHHEGRVR